MAAAEYLVLSSLLDVHKIVDALSSGLFLRECEDFWVDDGWPDFAVPISLSQSGGLVDATRLSKLAVACIFIDSKDFQETLHIVELYRYRSLFWGHVWNEMQEIICPSPWMATLQKVVLHPGIIQFMRSIAAFTSMHCDYGFVNYQLLQAMTQPLTIVNTSQNNYLCFLCSQLGITPWATEDKNTPVIQYPLYGMSVSPVDHALILLVGAFAQHDEDPPQQIIDLRQCIQEHVLKREPSICQLLAMRWHRGRT